MKMTLSQFHTIHHLKTYFPTVHLFCLPHLGLPSEHFPRNSSINIIYEFIYPLSHHNIIFHNYDETGEVTALNRECPALNINKRNYYIAFDTK
jgi:hypothetical protein